MQREVLIKNLEKMAASDALSAEWKENVIEALADVKSMANQRLRLETLEAIETAVKRYQDLERRCIFLLKDAQHN